MTAPLPTSGEVEGVRERHGNYGDGRCASGEYWPCDAGRLLALVKAQGARLAAVLAECDAADEANRTDPEPQEAGGWVWAYRIRRAASGEGA